MTCNSGKMNMSNLSYRDVILFIEIVLYISLYKYGIVERLMNKNRTVRQKHLKHLTKFIVQCDYGFSVHSIFLNIYKYHILILLCNKMLNQKRLEEDAQGEAS